MEAVGPRCRRRVIGRGVWPLQGIPIGWLGLVVVGVLSLMPPLVSGVGPSIMPSVLIVDPLMCGGVVLLR
jgi:hypothetical protein